MSRPSWKRFQRGPNGLYAWVVKPDNTAEQRAVDAATVDAGTVIVSKGLVAGCFKPRHGIRAVVDGKKVELVICYECLSMSVYVDGKRSSALTVKGPEKVFNKFLTDAKVPLPKQPD